MDRVGPFRLRAGLDAVDGRREETPFLPLFGWSGEGEHHRGEEDESDDPEHERAGRQPDLERILREGGRRVTAVAVYQTRAVAGAELPDGPWDYTIFTSPSAVRAFCEAGHRLGGRSLAIGPTTANEMRDSGLPPTAIAGGPTPQALVRNILELEHAHTT